MRLGNLEIQNSLTYKTLNIEICLTTQLNKELASFQNIAPSPTSSSQASSPKDFSGIFLAQPRLSYFTLVPSNKSPVHLGTVRCLFWFTFFPLHFFYANACCKAKRLFSMIAAKQLLWILRSAPAYALQQTLWVNLPRVSQWGCPCRCRVHLDSSCTMFCLS